MTTFPNYITIQSMQMRKLLVAEASRYVGVSEVSGDNRGEYVQAFQRSLFRQPGDPWCLCFIWHCIEAVERLALELDPLRPKAHIHKTALCSAAWERSPIISRKTITEAVPGDVVIWINESTLAGHAGILTGKNNKGGFTTIEGNTSGSSGVDRDGDGVFEKNRLVGGWGTTKVVGFLRVWADQVVSAYSPRG